MDDTILHGLLNDCSSITWNDSRIPECEPLLCLFPAYEEQFSRRTGANDEHNTHIANELLEGQKSESWVCQNLHGLIVLC